MSEAPDTPQVRQYYERRGIWDCKPQIRLVYQRWIEKLRPFCPTGTLLEVGSGSGLLRDLMPGVLLSDVVELPWLDRIVDCLNIPFEAGSLDGIIALDLLHHVAEPHVFLREAARVLRPGGRLLLIEPFITPLSWFGYKLLHHEDVYLKDYHRAPQDGGSRDPWEGNLAVANLVFRRDLKDWARLQPDLTIIHLQRFSMFDFQLAAGFKPHAYVPHGLFKHLVKLDDWLLPLAPWVGFRICVVLEKSGKNPPSR